MSPRADGASGWKGLRLKLVWPSVVGPESGATDKELLRNAWRICSIKPGVAGFAKGYLDLRYCSSSAFVPML